MKKVLLLAFAALFLILGCSQTNTETYERYGGTLRVGVPSMPNFNKLIFPPNINSKVEKVMANFCYSGLLKYEPFTMELRPSLCRKIDISYDQTEFTLFLDSTAQFPPDPCFGRERTRNVTAYDVEYTLRLMLQPDFQSSQIVTIFAPIKGIKNFIQLPQNQRDTAKIEGVEIIDNHTIKVTLETPTQYFLHALAHPSSTIMPREGLEWYGSTCTLGIGPFSIVRDSSRTFTYVKRPNHFEKDSYGYQLPYLDSVQVFNNTTTALKTMFYANKLDMLYLYKDDMLQEVFNGMPDSIDYEIGRYSEGFYVVRKYVKGLNISSNSYVEYYTNTYLER